MNSRLEEVSVPLVRQTLRAPDQVTLHLVTLHRCQHGELLLRFDPLRQHWSPKAMGQADHRANNPYRLFAGTEGCYEAAIDLDAVERKRIQI